MASSKITVLVVEDESFLRMHAVDVIENAGFSVVEASSTDEAIAILRERTDIRIVFTDIHLAGSSIDGLKLAALIRERWPPIDLIITSGQSVPEAEMMPARSQFFSKPYDPQKLVEAISRLAA